MSEILEMENGTSAMTPALVGFQIQSNRICVLLIHICFFIQELIEINLNIYLLTSVWNMNIDQ